MANLQITNAYLIDSKGNALNAVAHGSQVWIQSEWLASGTKAAQQYYVSFEVDGVVLESSYIDGQAGTNLPFAWYRNGWYASPGTHQVTVKVDAGDQIAETDETDNTFSFQFSTQAPVSLPSKFQWPLGGVAGRDWSIINYVDVDPTSASPRDFAGGNYTFDGHDAFDITLPNFARMDAGVPVYAAAAGTVADVRDGYFDRQTEANQDQSNFVRIDHGNGWFTSYHHLMLSTPAVQIGDSVVAGQLIGLAGSSGSSTDAHLHFAVYHRGLNIETMYAPSDYFVDPPVYQALQPTTVLDSGISNAPVEADIKERPEEIGTFPTSRSWDAWFWMRPSHFRAGDQVQVRWIRPGGALDTTNDFTPGSTRGGYYYWTLPATKWSAFPGTWQVSATVNGTEIARRSFLVTAGAGQPEVRVERNSARVSDGRITPVALGAVNAGEASPQSEFVVKNLGAAPLSLANLSLPRGVLLVGSFPSSIPAGGSATFTLALDTTRVLTMFGEVRFETNDPDEGVFTFIVRGRSNGTMPVRAPVLTLSDDARAYPYDAPALAIDRFFTLTDSDSTDFNTGSLTVQFAANGRDDDRLGIRNFGTGSGQIGVSGNAVTYGGVAIGTFSGGTGRTPLVVQLNAQATVTAVQTLLRNITFDDAGATPDTSPRFVSFTLIDDTGRMGNVVVKTILQDGAPPPVGILVAAASPLNVTEAGGTATFTVALASRPTSVVTLSLASSDTTEGTVSPATITFTPDDWSAPRTVTVAGVEDEEADGAVAFAIRGTVASLDARYHGLAVADVPVVNADNDTRGIVVTAAPNLRTTEAGGTASFTVRLSSRPTATVVIALSSSKTGEGTVSPGSLTFGPDDWSAPKTVTVTGVDDSLQDGDVAYAIVTAPAVSADPAYNGLDAADVSVTNADNDHPPVLDPIADVPSAPELALLTFTARASDPDAGPSPRFSLAGGAPAGAAIDPATGVFTWTPTEAQGPGTYTITVIATDAVTPVLTASRTFTVTVAEVNSAPTLLPIANRTVVEGQPLAFTLAGTDAETPASGLRYGLIEGVPAGLAYDPVSGLVTWTPSEAQGPGTYTIRAQVRDDDPSPLTASQVFTITVLEANQPPVLAPIADATVVEGTPVRFTATATDPDLPAQALVFGLGAGAPAGASINPATGAFSWTPMSGPTSATITVVVSDGPGGLSDTRSFRVTVTGQAPTVAVGADEAISTDGKFARLGSFADPGLQTWTARVDYGDGAGPQALALNPDRTFRLDHAYAASGRYRVTVTVVDSSGAEGASTFLVTVPSVPVVPAPSPGEPTGDVAPPRVSAVSLTKKKGAIGTIVAGFSEAIGAAGTGNFRLVSAGKDRKFGTKDDKVIGLKSASLDGDSRRVTLVPRGKLVASSSLKLTVSGLVDAALNALDGDGDGRPGGDYVAYLGRKAKGGA